MSKLITYKVDQGIGILKIDRPEARNALNWAAQGQFADAVANAAEDSSLRVLIITGSGDKAFASGGDLKELAGHPEEATAVRLTQVMSRALDRLIRMPVPVIAAANGEAIGGGCEIMTACDLRVAVENARFRFAQVEVGLTTGWGGSARLIHLLAASRAMELLMTGRSFSAREALSFGFVHRLADDGQVMNRALEWADALMSLPKEALAANKRLTWEAASLSLQRGYQLEKELFVDLWSRPDHLEAMAAFIEKRPPTFGTEANYLE